MLPCISECGCLSCSADFSAILAILPSLTRLLVCHKPGRQVLNGWDKDVRIDKPRLPTGINHFTVKGSEVGEERVDLVFQRVRDRVTVFTNGDKNENVKVLTSI